MPRGRKKRERFALLSKNHRSLYRHKGSIAPQHISPGSLNVCTDNILRKIPRGGITMKRKIRLINRIVFMEGINPGVLLSNEVAGFWTQGTFFVSRVGGAASVRVSGVWDNIQEEILFHTHPPIVNVPILIAPDSLKKNTGALVLPPHRNTYTPITCRYIRQPTTRFSPVWGIQH